MTNIEFSSAFDVYYNNIASNTAPGINEYEKSVFLTKAQNEILSNYFHKAGNKYQDGFDNSEKRQIDFSKLLVSVKPREFLNPEYTKFDDRSHLYEFPKDVLFVINETAITNDGEVKRLVNIIPIHYKEYGRLMSKPYKQPLKNQGWRILQNFGDTTVIEVIAKYHTSVVDYTLRYIRKPKPIILVNLEEEYGEGITIDGQFEESECELDPSIHQEILQRAVELAKISMLGDPAGIIEIGKRSE